MEKYVQKSDIHTYMCINKDGVMNNIPLHNGSKTPDLTLYTHMEWTVSLDTAKDNFNLPQGCLWVCIG